MSLSWIFSKLFNRAIKFLSVLPPTRSDNLSFPGLTPLPTPSGAFHYPANVRALWYLGFLCRFCSRPAACPSLCSCPVAWVPQLSLSRYTPLCGYSSSPSSILRKQFIRDEFWKLRLSENKYVLSSQVFLLVLWDVTL